jgi:L-ascorbate metabolism protein UlaG (beta-lactamase superfamily)
LSRFVVPVLSVGDQRLCNENMLGGEDRLEYLEGLVAYLNTLLAAGHSLEEVREFLTQVPFAALVTLDETSAVRAKKHEQAQDAIAFRMERLTTQFLDGRKRRAAEMVSLGSAEATPALGRLISRLCWGARLGDLVDLGESVGLELDADFFQTMWAKGVIETGETLGESHRSPRMAAQFGREDSGCRVTWLGHAAVVLECQGTTLWVDPYLFPVIRWREGELAKHFSPDFADSVLLSPYGPECAQLSAWELPKPDAILITHQDVDHFVPGVLMGAPETATLVVPKAVPGSKVDLDLEKVTHSILGPRPVRPLAHGECLQVGAFKISAFPFGGEVPADIEHAWNCYLVEAENSAVALCADSAIDAPQEEFLINRIGDRKGNLLLMARGRMDGDELWPGYRDQALELLSGLRLWGWYCRPFKLFSPVVKPGVSRVMLERLARHAGLSAFFPYATGSLPWLRFSDPAEPLASKVGSLSLAEFRLLEKLAESAGVRVPAMKYGVPYTLG